MAILWVVTGMFLTAIRVSYYYTRAKHYLFGHPRSELYCDEGEMYCLDCGVRVYHWNTDYRK